jgi:hydrogenase nickel incorporation protein HypA/HybF
MHEHGLIRDLLRHVREAAAAEKAERIVSVSVWLGALSYISADHFREHFDEEAAGTPAAHARLDITVSDDIGHPRATDILIEGVELEVPE